MPDIIDTPPQVSLVKPKINVCLIAFFGIFFLLVGLVLGYQLKNINLSPKTITPNLNQKAAVKTGELKIGGILPLTGDAAAYGIPIQQAAFVAQKEINAAGGIGGRQIKIIWKDGRCEKNASQTAAEQLINEEKVEFLIGGACSSEFLNSAPVAQAKKVISFSSSATSPKISYLGKYIFRTCPSDALAGKAAAGYAYNKWNAKTAGIIAESKDYTRALGDVFSKDFTSMGGKILFDETFATGTTDFTDLAGKAKEARADVVYILPQSPTPGVLLAKALKDQEVTSQILTTQVLLIRDALQEQGEILEGVTGIEVLFDETKPKAKHFLELYKKEYNLDPTYPGFMAGMYDVIYLVKGALESGAKDSDQIASWLYGLESWDGAVGELEFNNQGDPSLVYSIRKISGFAAPQVDTYVPTP